MNAYRKLIVAIIGLVVVQANPFALAYLGFDLVANQQMIVDAAFAALTAFGVYQVPND